MKYVYLSFIVFFSLGLSAQDFSGLKEVSVADAISFSDNDLAEALELQKFTLKFELHEAFKENPRVLGIAIRNSADVSLKFKQYLQSATEVERTAIEQELLEFYD